MKINKMSSMFEAPEWFNVVASEKTEVEKTVESVQPIETKTPNDAEIVSECEKIETIASSQENYEYPCNWDESSINHVVEYALACGISKDMIKMASRKQERVVTASTEKSEDNRKIQPQSEDNRKILDIGDAFRFDEKIAKAERSQDDWEQNRPQKNLKEAPVMIGNVIPVRGGESSLINNTPNLAQNQNSISNPDAIEQLANSEEKDSATRIAEAIDARRAEKKEATRQWEQDKINAMEHKDIVAKGTVFPTETLNAQSGLGSTNRPGNTSFDADAMPERTVGEMLKEASEERRKSIKQEFQKDEWEEVRGESLMGAVSDTFSEELKKRLGKGA